MGFIGMVRWGFITLLLAALMTPLVVWGQQNTTPAAGSSPTTGAAASAKSAAQAGGKASQSTPATKSRTGVAGARTATPLVLKTDKDKESYALGMNVGKSLKKDGVEVDPKIVARGIADALAGGKTLLSDEEARAALVTLQGDVRKRQTAELEVLGGANKQEGDAFLAANKAQQGVTTTPDGLQYKVLKQGDGPKPTAGDSVVCNYRGTLLNNKEFDSSYKRGQAATFPVSGVIKGWTEALQLMPVGSKWQIVVPPELGYGARGAGADIGPNSTLVFEIELLSIHPKDTK
ncbi:MAG TPA: FKBP-type peptidyl-prolyl cis-trans isomerase [Candidatus Eisenbacteria bacterium]|jgi:FKBP-type peptidyl-prolyl cis-trans isomerase|nr:FKBP-type peptidyl-prolyl cis-trans isomerase [Candidatus Eisenbacteria bacterium]